MQKVLLSGTFLLLLYISYNINLLGCFWNIYSGMFTRILWCFLHCLQYSIKFLTDRKINKWKKSWTAGNIKNAAMGREWVNQAVWFALLSPKAGFMVSITAPRPEGHAGWLPAPIAMVMCKENLLKNTVPVWIATSTRRYLRKKGINLRSPLSWWNDYGKARIISQEILFDISFNSFL